MDNLKHLKKNLLKTKKFDVNNSRVKLIKTFQKLCKLYDIEFNIEVNDSANYNFDTQVLSINTKCLHFDIETIIQVFCHELAHHIQYLAYDDDDLDYYYENYNNLLHLEREAERFAYFVVKNHFNYFIHHSKFTCYRTKEDKETLFNFFNVSYGSLEFELA